MSGDQRPGERDRAGRDPLRLYTITSPPMIAGNCISPFFSSSSGFIGISEAPKATVFAVICLIAAARTDRLIVEPDSAHLAVGVRPLGVNRIRKRRARAGDIGCEDGAYLGRGERT